MGFPGGEMKPYPIERETAKNKAVTRRAMDRTLRLQKELENFSSKFTEVINQKYELRAQKMLEQNVASIAVTALMKEYEKDSVKQLSNIDAAVTVSKQPGFIEYREARKQDVPEIRALCDQLTGLEAEIRRLDLEIKSLKKQDLKARSVATEGAKVSPQSFKAWFSVFGKPHTKREMPEQKMLSKFIKQKRPIQNFGFGDDGKPLQGKAALKTGVPSNAVNIKKGILTL